jgi:DNA-binding NtrC family response regulator
LVDDETEFVETLALRLETRGLRVDTADSGEAAIAKVQEKQYDAILLDLAMPGMDGVEALQRIREHNPDSQVIVVTGRATVQNAKEVMRLGALDLLEKPVEIETLTELIDQAATNKIRLTDQRIAEKMKDIMGKKGW